MPVVNADRQGRDAVNESEWLACTDPKAMLEFLAGKVSERKLRLFLCACSHHIERALTDCRSWQAIEVAERYVDGTATSDELAAAHAAACEAARLCGDRLREELSTAPASLHERLRNGNADDPEVARVYCKMDAVSAAWQAAHTACDEINDEWTATRNWKPDAVIQCGLLREIVFLLPFHSLKLSQSWLSGSNRTVLQLAQVIYDEKTFDLLPILADALEEAGCQEVILLNHCRQPRGHVRGCWVVDLLLGKE